MTSLDKWNDDQTWDRVADQPLPPQQLAELVAACDQRPELWKRCALALLEEQALRHELQAMTREQLIGGQSMSQVDAAEPLPTLETPLPSPAPSQPQSRGGKANRLANGLRSPWWNVMALAASLLMTFGIGWQASVRFGSRGNAVPNISDSSSIDLAGSPVAGGHISSPAMPAPVDSLLADAVSSDVMPINQAQIEEVNAQSLATALQSNWEQMELEPEYQKLERKGYNVDAQKGLMQLWLNDGSTAVIPYQQIKVRPKTAGGTY